MSSRHVLLMTGAPGVGKTTLLRELASSLPGRRLAGFTTEEIREGGARHGFRIVPFRGPERIMAHVAFRNLEGVGRYGVDVAVIDAVVEAELGLDPAVDLYVVDEIGKMECLSDRFVRAVRALLRSEKPMVASVGARGGGFLAEVKRCPEAELWGVTRGNRDALLPKVLAWIEARRCFEQGA